MKKTLKSSIAILISSFLILAAIAPPVQADDDLYYKSKFYASLLLINQEARMSAQIINGFLLDPQSFKTQQERLECVKNKYPQRYMDDGTYETMNLVHKQIVEYVQQLQSVPPEYQEAYNLVFQMSVLSNDLYQNAVQSDPHVINFNMPKYMFISKTSEWKSEFLNLAYQLHLKYPNFYYEDDLRKKFTERLPMTANEGVKN